MDEDEITEERKQKDILIRKGVNRSKRLMREANEAIINKLPNEFRSNFRDWNPYNTYNGDSYCGQYYGEDTDV